MKIYTKKGDTGQTSLIGGTKVSKDHIRIEAYGTVDELNAWIGMVRDHDIDAAISEILRKVQDDLFVIGSTLASDPGKSKMEIPDLSESDVEILEQGIDGMNEELDELKFFVLPGGHQAVSACHLARVVCRRAERTTVRLAASSEVPPLVIKYLNRLSDYLFVLGRKVGKDLGVDEVRWKGGE